MAHIKLDNTMVDCFNRCPRKFYWRHVRHLVRKGKVSPPLAFGSAIHLALEIAYKGSSKEEAMTMFLANYDDDDGTGKRTPENGLVILEAYWDRYFPEMNWEVLHTEDHTAVELTSDILYVGKIDLIVKHLGIIYIVDHKTSSNMRFVTEPNHQMTGYVHNARELGFDCSGAIINMIGVYKTKTEFKRPMTMRSNDDILEWKHYVCDTKMRMDLCFDERWFPCFAHSCYNFGSMCPYEELCICSKGVQDYIIEGSYEEEKWEPWLHNK